MMGATLTTINFEERIWGTGALKALEIWISGRKCGPAGTFEDSVPGEALRECSIPDLLERPEVVISTGPERELSLAYPMG